MNKRKNTKLLKVDMPITAALFTSLINYLLSDYCSRSFVVKLERFFDEVNEKLYEEDGDLEIYHRIIKRIMRLILIENVKDPDVIVEKITSSPRDGDEIYEFLEDLLETMGEEEMNSSLALFVENEFISRLNYVNVTPKAEKLRLILSKLENQDYNSYDEIIEDLHTSSNEMNKAVISKSSAAVTLPDVTFGDTDAFNMALRKVRNFMNDDKRVIKTGIKRLNKFLNGGWQAGRVYLANGISGGLTELSSL